MSDSVQPHKWQPTRLPHPWDSPGRNTGVGCHFLLQCMKVKSESEVVQSCPTLSDPMDCSLPGSSICGIFQARVLEWGAIAFSVTVRILSFKIFQMIYMCILSYFPKILICYLFFNITHIYVCLSHIIYLEKTRTLNNSISLNHHIKDHLNGSERYLIKVSNNSW